MIESKANLAKFLIAVADALNSMDSREFELLLDGKAKLRIAENRKTEKRILDDSNLNKAVNELAERLKNADSRGAAKRVIASISHSRKREFLVLLAEACDIRVMSKDTIGTIEQKLIESVVGSKLRSKAIRKVDF
ncbi:MAG: hypothetical protein OXF86_09590 [Caldilineaceae bacterium]|nr:hypothetical protein [Caldilineaceae bacterium]